jgi:hypothetical protein
MTKPLAAIGMFVCMAATALPAAARKNKLNPAAVALFEKAIAASDIETEGAQPFRLQASVQVAGSNDKRSDGVLVKFWAPGGGEREETIFPGYQLVEVSDGQRRWEKSNVEYVPYSVHALWEALAFVPRLRGWLGTGKQAQETEIGPIWQQFILAPGSVPTAHPEKSLSKPKKGGEECTQAKIALVHQEMFCFDPVSGNLVREEDKTLGVTYEYSGYAAFGQKSFPRIARVFSDKKELAEIHINRIDPSTNPSPKMLLPEEGSQMEGCEKAKPPKIVKVVPPIHPFNPSGNDAEGTVALYGYLGTDGAIHGLWTLQSPSRLLTAASIEVVNQWRYKPAVCEDNGVAKPVPEVIYITFIFNME